jgi:hypothetical protein
MSSEEKEDKVYEPLRRGSVDEWSEETMKLSPLHRRFSLWDWPTLFVTLFAVSLTANVFLAVRGTIQRELSESDCPSFYGRLQDVHVVWEYLS